MSGAGRTQLEISLDLGRSFHQQEMGARIRLPNMATLRSPDRDTPTGTGRDFVVLSLLG
jgi:hypothetical protein